MSNSYAEQQLGNALVTAAVHEDEATRLRAHERVQAWTSVLDGLGDGTLKLGSRTLVADLPAWVTLEVVRGGFATGKRMAGGELELDEIRRAARLGLPHTRAALFASYLTDDGLAELRELIATGAYEVRIPEDAVLLVVGYLSGHEARANALDLLDIVRPFIDTLRFMPRAAAPQQTPPGQVSRRTAAEVRERLQLTKEQARVEAQRESIEVWQPLTDRFVALWWSTKNGEWTEAHSELAATLLSDYDEALKHHELCWNKSRVKSETLPRFVDAARAQLEGNITEPHLRSIGELVTSVVTKRGEPGSDRLKELRDIQAGIAATPSHQKLAQVAAARCALLRTDEGIADIAAILVPVSSQEAEIFGVPAGALIPASVERKVRMCTVGSLESLLQDGIIPSAEVLAELLPVLTGQQVGSRYDDPELARLMSAVYEAFRRRRSLLLWDLARQVQFEDLPWVSTLEAHARSHTNTGLAVARRIAAAAIDAFPGTLLPNPLIQELTTLYDVAGQPIPLTPELAADIFEGRFSSRFVQAAGIAASKLEGSLYERYYDLDFAAIQHTAFDRLCNEAAPQEGYWVARNGMVIERQQLLTTQNLAVLVTTGGVQPTRPWLDLAVAAAQHCAGLLQLAQRQDRPLATVKDAAYAWRQALFFLTMAGDEQVHAFLGQVNASTWPMSEVLDGLRFVADGGRFDVAGIGGQGKRLLGWTVTPHWAVQRPSLVQTP